MNRSYLQVQDVQAYDKRSPPEYEKVHRRQHHVSHEKHKVPMIKVPYTVVDPRTLWPIYTHTVR